jgi:predicted phage terminase large subunit-like protein
LLDALRGIDDPNYTAVIFRKNFPMLRVAGGLISISHSIYPLVGGKFNSSISEWKFPHSGATISFRHLQHSHTHFDYQGAQFTFIGIDEAAHFESKEQIIYLFSRNRSIAKYRPWVRMTCNPSADSWLAPMIKWWIDEAGYPIPERSGIIRYFVTSEDEFVFANTVQELRDRYPDSIPKSFTFIPSKLEDNPILMESDPGYKANLMMQHSIERARLLHGNWKIKAEAGKIFNSGWFKTIPAPSEYSALVRFYDFAATAREVNEKAFYTAGILLGICEDGTYEIVDAIAEQLNPSDSDKLMIKTAKRDGKNVFVAWELEGGSAGIRMAEYLTERLKGYSTHALRPQGDKVTRALPVATDAEQGRVRLVEGDWNEQFKDMIHRFDGTPKPLTNDYCDALSGAHAFLRDPEKLSARQYARFLRGEI